MVTLARVSNDEPGSDALGDMLEPVLRQFTLRTPTRASRGLWRAKMAALAHAGQYVVLASPTSPIHRRRRHRGGPRLEPTRWPPPAPRRRRGHRHHLEDVEGSFGPVVPGRRRRHKLDRLQFDSKEASRPPPSARCSLQWRATGGCSDQARGPPAQHAHLRSCRVEAAAHRQETSTSMRPGHRLGVQQVKWQLEDLAFATLHPKRYAEIEQMVGHGPPARGVSRRVLISVRERLGSASLDAEVTGRPKHSGASTRRWWCAARNSTTSTISWASASWSPRRRTAGRSRGHPRIWRRCRADSRLHQHPKFNLYSRCTPRSSVSTASRSRSRCAPRMHRRAEFASPPTGLQGEGRRLLGHAWMQRIAEVGEDTERTRRVLEP